MTDVDERVVQMKFDSSDFETKTKSTFKILDTLKEKLSFKEETDDSANLLAIADNVQKVADKAYTIIDRTIDKIKDNIANKLVSYLRVNTIGQIEAGWSKYADMTTSVSTLKAQGYAMETINEQLERLMYFTDETSFKFTDMVGEIGKFTASGQKLEDATQAMMGIALWASLSGKNANDASRAMYQLSQALSAGEMRLQDYKSIQNLNMDTREFRQNAIDAAVAVGTLKDNLNGTWTSTKNTKVIVDLQNFAETLTKGKWFTTDVMMAVYEQYSEAVDEIHEKYVELGETVPTAQLIKEAKEANDRALSEFEDLNMDRRDVDKLLKKWKKVVKVTDAVVDDYAEINEITKDTARQELTTRYAEYLQEYAELFKGTEADAEAALEKWQAYTSEFGIKAFMSGQEAKTFTEAVESAMDAASTVWLHIYQDIFGNYDEAKELWTSLANNLYDIFVGRLWSIAEIFDYWKSGYAEDMQAELENTKKEYNATLKQLNANKKKNSSLAFTNGEGQAETIADQEERLDRLKAKIEEMQFKMENGLYDGRRVLMQGLEAFGAGFKSISSNFRTAWDALFDENESGKKLFAFSERFRELGFRFYLMMKQFMPDEETGEFANKFFPNIAQSVSNLLQPFKALVEIVKSVIGQFLPSGKTFAETLEMISERIKEITSHLVPSRETIVKIARILRGVVAVIKFIGKAIYGFYTTILRPILSLIFKAVGTIADAILDVLADLGDLFFQFEEGTSSAEAFAMVWDKIKIIFEALGEAIKFVAGIILKVLSPVLNFVKGILEVIATKIKKLFKNGNGNFAENIANGFKNIKKRATDAWKSTESFADIFNRFKEGKGAANFIELFGELLQSLITKIGMTIHAIFNLEEAFDDSKLSEGGKKVKEFLLTTVEVIKWLWTNVLQPMVQTFFQGMGTLFRTLAEQVKNGDIKGLLETLREIIKTFTSMQLFKMLQVITKVFGSGGLLRLMRNASKALRGLWMMEGAMAMDYLSKALLKLAIAFSIVAAALAVLTYLPTENLEKLNKMLISFTILFAITAGVLITITALADRASWGFLGMGFAFGSLAVVMFAFIWAASELDKKLEKICQTVDETTGEVKDPELIDYIQKLGGTILSFLTIMGVVLSIFVIMKKVVGGTSGITFTLGFIGLITAVSSIVNAINTLVNIFHREDTTMEEVIIAIGLLMGIFVALAFATRIMSHLFSKGGTKFKEGIGEGIGYAIALSAMALIIRMVLIPTLDTLVENKDKFPDYLQALGLIVACMLGMGATIGLMARGTKALGLIAGGIVFKWITNSLQDVIIPALQSLANVKFGDVIGGVIALGALMNALAAAILIMSIGISKILAALMSINWKAMLSLSITIGLVIIAIMTLTAVMNNFGEAFDPTPIWMIVGVIGAIFGIIAVFGLISNGLLAVRSKMAAVASMILAITALVTVIGLATAGLLYVISEMFYGDEDWAIGIMMTFFIGIAGILLAMAISFGIMTSALKKAFSLTLNKEELALFTGVIVATLLFVSIMIAEVAGAIALIATVYKDTSTGEKLGNVLIDSIFGLLFPIITLLGSIVVFIGLIGELMIKFAKIPGLITEIKLMMILTMALISGLLFIITACLTVLRFNGFGNNIANSFLLLAMTIIPILTYLYAVAKFINAVDLSAFNPMLFKVLIVTVGGFVASLALMIPILAVLGSIELLDYKNVGNMLLLFVATLASIFIAAGLFLTATQKLIITTNQVKSLAVALAGIASILLILGLTVLPAMENLKGTDPNSIFAVLTGLSLLIVVTLGMIAALGALKTFSWDRSLSGALVFFTVLGTIALFGPKLIEMFKEFEEINFWAVIGAIIAFVAPFAAIMGLIALVGPVAGGFLIGAGTIATGFAIMAGGIYLFTLALGGLFDLLGIDLSGKIKESADNIAEGITDEFADNKRDLEKATEKNLVKPVNDTAKDGWKENSPSKVFRQYGKFIDQGLAQGIIKNVSYATDASEDLAEGTNDEFCDTLEIASPSKVFYENGRFVIRGLINGMNSYKGKAYDTGSTVGEGISDALNESLNGSFKDNFLGIWNNEEMDGVITEAGEKMSKGLLGGLFGEETSALSDEEKKRLEAMEKELEELEKRKEEASKGKGSWTTADQANYENLKTQINDLKNKANTTVTELQGKIENILGGGLSNILEGDEGLGSKIFGWLGGVKDSILGWVGGDEDSLKTELNDTLNGEGGVVEETINNAGTQIEGGLSTMLENLTGSTDLSDGANGLGKKLGSSIWDGLSEKLGEVFHIEDIMHFFLGDEIAGTNKASYLKWLTSNDQYYGLRNDKKFNDLMSIFLNQNDNFEFSEEYYENIAKQYRDLGGAKDYLNNIHLNDAGKVVFDIDYSSYLRDLADNTGVSDIGKDFLPKMADAIDRFIESGGDLERIDFGIDKITEYFHAYEEAKKNGYTISTISIHDIAEELNISTTPQDQKFMNLTDLLGSLFGVNNIVSDSYGKYILDEYLGHNSQLSFQTHDSTAADLVKELAKEGLVLTEEEAAELIIKANEKGYGSLSELLGREHSGYSGDIYDKDYLMTQKDYVFRWGNTENWLHLQNLAKEIIKERPNQYENFVTTLDRIDQYYYNKRTQPLLDALSEYEKFTTTADRVYYRSGIDKLIEHLDVYIGSKYNMTGYSNSREYYNSDEYRRQKNLEKIQASRDRAIKRALESPQDKENTKIVKRYVEENKDYFSELLGYNLDELELSYDQTEDLRDQLITLGLLDKETGHIKNSIDDYYGWTQMDQLNRNTFYDSVTSMFAELISITKEKEPKETTKPSNSDIYGFAKYAIDNAGSKKALDELYAKAPYDKEAAKYLESILGGKDYKTLLSEIESRYYDLNLKKSRNMTLTATEKAEMKLYENNYDMNNAKARSEAVNQVSSYIKKMANANKDDIGKNTKLWGDWINTYKEAYNISDEEIQGLIDGLSDKEKRFLQKQIDLASDGFYVFKKKAEINSPSKVYYGFGQNLVEGLNDGIIDNMTDSENTIEDWANLLTNDTKAGLTAMSDMLEEDVNPRITPILDSSSLNTGMTDINRAIDMSTPKVEATFNSFNRDNPNYDSKFDDLELAIGNTNYILGELMSLLETGDITTVNVEVQPSPDNIYDSVIKTNRQRFNRTGRNGFMI